MKKLLLAGVTLSLIVGSCMSASAAVFFQKESRLSFADAYCSAAAQNNSGAWRYVRDEGYGDYRTSSH